MVSDCNGFEWSIRLIVFWNKNIETFCYESLLGCFLDQQKNSCILSFYFKRFLDVTMLWLLKQVISQVYSIHSYSGIWSIACTLTCNITPFIQWTWSILMLFLHEILMAILLQIQHSHPQGYNIRNKVGHNYSNF